MRSTVANPPVPDLKLSCQGNAGPNRVTRGSTLTCTATVDPSGSATLTDVTWRFEDSTTQTPIVGPSDSTQWAGKMVVSGRIFVAGNLNGVAVARDTQVSVIARNWPRINVVAADSGHGDLLVVPLQIHDLAHTHPPRPLTGYDYETIGSGPNAGWTYLRSHIGNATAVVHIHSGFKSGTPFYNQQHPGTDPATGDPHCKKSEMGAVETGARQHEGISPSPALSHVEVYQRWFRNNAPQDSMEAAVVFAPALTYPLADYYEAEYVAMVATPAKNDPNQRHTNNVPPGLVPFPSVPCRPRF